MSRRNQPAKWVLPEVIDPTGRRCFVINVPDDPAHIAAFRGALLDLASAYKWADDAAHTAREVALVWRDVIEEMEACMPQLQFRTNPFNNCSLEVSFDEGVIWQQIFNARACALDTVNDSGVSHEIPGGANPEPRQCFDLDIVLQANSMRLIPLAVASGWSLTLSNVSGAWHDGAFLSIWRCPTGSEFFLGACGDASTYYYDASDPLPATPHLRLILRLPDGSHAAIPLDGTSYVVPDGQPAGNYFLMTNDSALGDNQGAVSLHLLACNSAGEATVSILNGFGTGPTGVQDAGVELTYTGAVTLVADGHTYYGVWVAFDRLVDVHWGTITGYHDGYTSSNTMFGYVQSVAQNNNFAAYAKYYYPQPNPPSGVWYSVSAVFVVSIDSQHTVPLTFELA